MIYEFALKGVGKKAGVPVRPEGRAGRRLLGISWFTALCVYIYI